MELPAADIEIEIPEPNVDIPLIIEEKSSEMSDFQTAERLLLSEVNAGNVLAMFEL